MQLTIFTPTYNRAYILERLFESLQQQPIRDFEWLIVDDGSTDNTEFMVNGFISDADFAVRYLKQSNQGKHIAINKAALKADGDYILIIDSDDYLGASCLQVCKSLIQDIDKKKNFAGFTFIRAPEKKDFKIEDYGTKKWSNNILYDWKIPGEMNFVFKKEILQMHPFPKFTGENFCQESVQLNSILRNYKVLYTDHILAFGDYLEDGLSQNLYERMLKNPRYAILSFKTKLVVAKNRAERNMLAKNYWDIVLKTKQPKIKALFGFPVILSLPILATKIFNIFKNRR